MATEIARIKEILEELLQEQGIKMSLSIKPVDSKLTYAKASFRSKRICVSACFLELAKRRIINKNGIKALLAHEISHYLTLPILNTIMIYSTILIIVSCALGLFFMSSNSLVVSIVLLVSLILLLARAFIFISEYLADFSVILMLGPSRIEEAYIAIYGKEQGIFLGEK